MVASQIGSDLGQVSLGHSMPPIFFPDDDELRRHPLARRGWKLNILLDDARGRRRVYYAVPPRKEARCSQCGAKAWLHQGRLTKSIYRDIPQDGKLIQLRVLRRRLECSRCGLVFPEHPADLDRDLQITAALLTSVRSDLLHFETFSSIAQQYGLSISGVKKIEAVIVRREDEKRNNDPMFSLPRHVGFHNARIAKTDCCLLTDPNNRSIWELVSSQDPKEIPERSKHSSADLNLMTSNWCRFR